MTNVAYRGKRLTKEIKEAMVAEYMVSKDHVDVICERYGVHRTTFYRILKVVASGQPLEDSKAVGNRRKRSLIGKCRKCTITIPNYRKFCEKCFAEGGVDDGEKNNEKDN